MNVFFEKIFKSFPNRQNFKIFPQRACKHLQNRKKYVIINKLISITIKNGLMVKRLRRCPLTAESAVRFRMGLPKNAKPTHQVLASRFLLPLSGTYAATCCRRSSICRGANFCRGFPLAGNGNIAYPINILCFFLWHSVRGNLLLSFVNLPQEAASKSLFC